MSPCSWEWRIPGAIELLPTISLQIGNGVFYLKYTSKVAREVLIFFLQYITCTGKITCFKLLKLDLSYKYFNFLQIV